MSIEDEIIREAELLASIRSLQSEAALAECLAEEAVELAHAAMKYARILREESPTPVKVEDIIEHLEEEYADVRLTADVLGIELDANIYSQKLERWYNRLREARK